MEKLLGGLWCGVVTNDIEPLIQFLEAGALLLGRRNGIAHDGEHHTIRLCTCFKCKQTTFGKMKNVVDYLYLEQFNTNR